MPQKFVNAGRFELLSPLASTGTTLNLLNGAALPPATAGTGALTSGDWFRLVLQDADQIEVVTVRTHISGSDQLTNVLRGQEGTTARDWPAGTVIGNRWTAADADTAVNGKVDKETGKGLSSSDFTAAEKTKLAGVAVGATANSTDAQLRDRATHTGITPVSGGGTGSNTAAGARTTLGLKSAALADILGTVSQSGGVPTGAIVQRGSNANGEFVRFADGTQICSREIVIASREYAAGAAYEWGNWTFPAAFLVRPVIPCPGDHGGWSQDFRVTAEYADTTTLGQITIKNIGTATRTQPRYVSLLAIGRWF